MNNNPLVTIMIPTYNQDRFLEDTIRSALAQTYKNKQILVLDDCSGDNTEKIVEKFLEFKEIEYIKRTDNLGRVGNYRSGLFDHAEGEWVLNLDGDDLLVDNCFLENAVKAAGTDEDIVLVTADRLIIDAEKRFADFYRECGPPREVLGEIVSGNDFLLGIPRKKYRIYHLTSLYKKKSAMELDFYSHDIISSDYESLFRLMLGKKVLLLKEKVAAWRSHGENESGTINIVKLMKNYELYNSVFSYNDKNGFLSSFTMKRWRANAVARKYYTNILTLMKNRKYKEIKELSKYIFSEFSSAFFKTLINPKLYYKVIMKKY